MPRLVLKLKRDHYLTFATSCVLWVLLIWVTSMVLIVR
jgi:hypothetical protein